MSTKLHHSEPDADYREPARTDPEPPTGQRQRRLLRRSKKDRVIAGVSGGLGRYFDRDPVLFRIAFLLMLFLGGFGILLYLIAWLAIPEFRNIDDEIRDSQYDPVESRIAGTIVGGALILFGVLILTQRFIDWFDPRIVGGGLLILVGLIIVLRGMQSEGSQ